MGIESVLIACLPSAITGFCFWCIEQKIQKQSKKLEKRCSFDCCRISESWPGQSHQNCEGRKAPVPYRTH